MAIVRTDNILIKKKLLFISSSLVETTEYAVVMKGLQAITVPAVNFRL